MADFFDRFVADLTKGASETEGFIRGGRVSVQAQRDPSGFEQKLAAAKPPPIPVQALMAGARPKQPAFLPGVHAEEFRPRKKRQPGAPEAGSVGQSYTKGAEAALEAFGVKEAFISAVLPMAASFLGGSALKRGLGFAAGKFLPGAKGIGGAIGNIARRGQAVLNKGGMGADAMNMGANMAAGEVANRMVGPSQ